jgi:tetratricopeptide (TPR) repeat protein
MTKTARDRSRTAKIKGSPGKRRLLFMVAASLCGVLLAAWLGLAVWRRARTPELPGREAALSEPPSADLAGADPAVTQAIEAARRAVRQAPHSAQAWGRLGMVLRAHDLTAEAKDCFIRAEQLDPREPRWPYYQGLSLAQGSPDAAIPKFQRAVELLGDSADTPRLRLAELLLGQGRLDEAEREFRHILQRHPDNPRAHLGVGRLAHQRGNWQESREHLAFTTNDLHTRKSAHALLAEIYQRLGNTIAADQARRQAAELPDDPAWPDPLVEEFVRLRTGKQGSIEHANLLLDQGRVPEAIAFLQQAVRDYPDADWAWLLLGRALLKRQEMAAAEQALRNAVRLAPDSVEAQFHLGLTLFSRKEDRAAAACFRKVAELKPDAQAYYLLGHCLARQGDEGNAVEAFRTALRYKPNYAQAHLDLGTLLAKRGQNGDALLHLGYAVQLDPANLRAKKLLQQVLMRIPIPLGP